MRAAYDHIPQYFGQQHAVDNPAVPIGEQKVPARVIIVHADHRKAVTRPSVKRGKLVGGLYVQAWKELVELLDQLLSFLGQHRVSLVCGGGLFIQTADDDAVILRRSHVHVRAGSLPDQRAVGPHGQVVDGV